MKKFLLKLRFFALILVLMWLGIEALYRLVPNNYVEKNKNVVKYYKDTEVLIFGNSHAFYGLNPAFFNKKTFNISNISQTLYFDKLLFDKHIDSLKFIKAIILPIEYSSLRNNDHHPELQWRKYFYEEQMDLNVSSISYIDPRKYSLALVPRFSLTVSAIKQYLNKGTLAECTEKGWGQYYGVSTHNNMETGKAVVKKHEYGTLDFSLNIKRINSIIKKCRQRKIKVILVTMPVTSYYADNVRKEQLNKIIIQCSAFQENEGVYYINLFQDKRFNNTDFYDVDHLNTQGAKNCSEIVDNYINRRI